MKAIRDFADSFLYIGLSAGWFTFLHIQPTWTFAITSIVVWFLTRLVIAFISKEAA